MDWHLKFANISICPAKDNTEPLKCKHTDISESADFNICSDCGFVLGRRFITEPQYSTNAVLRRTTASCPIYDDIPNEFDPVVKNLAVIIYKTATVKKIYKSTLRKAIIAACVYRAANLLNMSTRKCFSSMGLTTAEANKGIMFVSTNLPHGEYRIPLFGGKSEIEAACSISGLTEESVDIVFNLFEKIKLDCESVFAASQRVSIVYGCVWTFIKWFVNEIPSHLTTTKPMRLQTLIAKLIEENSIKNARSRAVVSAVTIERKYYEIMNYILSRVMKRVFALCIAQIPHTSHPSHSPITILRSVTPKIPVTVYNCNNPDLIRIIADDGFVYPIENVDNVFDWNIIFDMKFEAIGHSNIIHLPITISHKSRSIIVSFSNCSSPINTIGDEILRKEVRYFIHS